MGFYMRILAVLGVAVILVGCGGAPAPETAEQPPAEEPPAETPVETATMTWTGWLADEKCALEGKAATDDHAGCAQGCVKGGQPIVFVSESDKAVYTLDSPDKVQEHVGHKVTLEGTMDGTTIAVASVTM